MVGTAQNAFAWQYGVSMTPTISGNYDSVEMPTQGFTWTTAPSSGAISFWVSSTTTGATNVFAQDGFMYNGLNVALCTGDCTTSIPANSWGVFWEWADPGGVYHGDETTSGTSGWSAGDNIYFSIAAYSAHGELSFKIYDSNQASTITKWKCSDTNVVGTFSGTVGGIDESSDANLSPGGIHVTNMSLWDQVISSGNRNSGNAASYVQGTPPNGDLTKVPTSPYIIMGFQSTGTHYGSSGTSIYTASWSSANENLPVNQC